MFKYKTISIFVCNKLIKITFVQLKIQNYLKITTILKCLNLTFMKFKKLKNDEYFAILNTLIIFRKI